MRKSKPERVLLRKRDAQLVEYFETCLGGWAIVWEDITDPSIANEPISDSSPLMFDDDPKFRLNDFIDLGEL